MTHWEDHNAGKQKEKGKAVDEMVRWHHQLNVHEFELTLWDSEGQGSLACWSSWNHKVEHDWTTTEQWQQQ